MNTQIYLAVLVILPFFAASQSHLTNQVSAQITLDQAIAAHNQEQYKEACQLAQVAYSFFQNQRDTLFAKAAFQLGRSCFALQNYDTAQLYFTEAAHYFPCPSIPCGDARHYIARCAWETNQLQKADSLFQKGLEIRRAIQPAAPCDISESLGALGDVYHTQNKYSDAVKMFVQAIAAQEHCSGAQSLGVAKLRSSLGMAYLRQGDYSMAQIELKECLLTQQQQLPENHADMAQTLYFLGNLYKSMVQPEESFFYYEKALAMYEKVYATNHTELAPMYDAIGQYYLQQKQYDKALVQLQKMNNIMLFHHQTESKSYAFSCSSFGRVYLGLKNYPKAVEWFEKMVAIWRANNPHVNSQLASMLTYLARAEVKNNQFEEGVAHFTEAIGIWESLGRHPYLPQGYSLLATAYKNEYLRRQNDEFLEKSRFWYHKAAEQITNQFRYETSQESLRKMLNEYSLTAYNEQQAEILLLRRQQGDDRVCLNRLWALQEQVHGYQLLVAMQEVLARSVSDVSEADRQRDSMLRADVIALEWQRMQLLDGGKLLNDPAVLTLDSKIIAQKNEVEKNLAELEQKNPRYTQQRYQRQTATLSEMQEALLPGQTVLSYVTGDSAVFAMVVQKNNVTAHEIRLNVSLVDQILQLRKGIEGYYTGKVKSPAGYEASVKQYVAAAEQLYQTLIAPISHALTEQIIIVPDGILNELPFDALLSGRPGDLTNFGTYPFLMHRYRISYAYSGATYRQVSRGAVAAPKSGLLAMAPFYQMDTTLLLSAGISMGSSDRQALTLLPYSGAEIQQIQGFYRDNSRLFTGKTATKERFWEYAGQYPVLHLATHGYANRKTGAYSYLAFAPDAHSNGILIAGELYALRLHAKLVVLSACETGMGEPQVGEGMIGLVRAFIFAGAESVVASLWQVNDRSTMPIMHFFHEELNKGVDRQMALTAAKRRYIAQNPGLQAHPYFWAAFTLHGATGVIGR